MPIFLKARTTNKKYSKDKSLHKLTHACLLNSMKEKNP